MPRPGKTRSARPKALAKRPAAPASSLPNWTARPRVASSCRSVTSSACPSNSSAWGKASMTWSPSIHKPSPTVCSVRNETDLQRIIDRVFFHAAFAIRVRRPLAWPSRYVARRNSRRSRALRTQGGDDGDEFDERLHGQPPAVRGDDPDRRRGIGTLSHGVESPGRSRHSVSSLGGRAVWTKAQRADPPGRTGSRGGSTARRVPDRSEKL